MCLYIIIAGVGFGGEEQDGSDVSLFSIPWLVISVASLFVSTVTYAAFHNL